ncbi:MAG TPA: TylF/MycF/NovP-related O-methyltransferase [Acidimicrobiales bacterium]|nr:TylF/MycF/NovP-related O-methyltransferase [Acidimicrobiales bacterium]
MVRSLVASALLTLGRRATGRHLVLLDAAVGHLALGRWLRQRGVRRVRRVATREDLFALALPSLRGRRPLYVELGVHRGDSIRWWASHLTDHDAALHGFDSFTGLPETWNDENTAGRFSTDGEVPTIDDPRVRFFPGWFDDTLPAYEPPPHDAVFLNFDADLYSSTTAGLRHLRPLISKGAWLYFDELNDKDHELRALDEFLHESDIDIEVVARAANGRHWLFLVRS